MTTYQQGYSVVMKIAGLSTKLAAQGDEEGPGLLNARIVGGAGLGAAGAGGLAIARDARLMLERPGYFEDTALPRAQRGVNAVADWAMDQVAKSPVYEQMSAASRMEFDDALTLLKSPHTVRSILEAHAHDASTYRKPRLAMSAGALGLGALSMGKGLYDYRQGREQ